MKNVIDEACSTYGKGRGVYRFLVGKPGGKRTEGGPDVDDKIMLRWVFCKKGVGLWTGTSWLKLGTGGGHVRMR